MADRFLRLGVSTEQGMVPIVDVKAMRLKTPADVITYRPPDAAATVIELDYNIERDRLMTELLSPEDEASLQYWITALRDTVQQVLSPVQR
jgi:hypothetical protein